MSHIIRKPHMSHSMRFVSADRKKSIERKTKARQELQGKKVIKLHSDATGKDYGWLKPYILEYHRENGRLPTTILDPKPRTTRCFIPTKEFGVVELLVRDHGTEWVTLA